MNYDLIDHVVTNPTTLFENIKFNVERATVFVNGEWAIRHVYIFPDGECLAYLPNDRLDLIRYKKIKMLR